MKKVLMVTDGFFHPPFRARKILHKTLAELDSCSFSHINSLEKLPDDLDSFVAVVIYIHHKKISKVALSKLDSFISTGGGLLGLHSATASFKNTPHYHEILGGCFTGHGPVRRFSILPVKHSDVFDGFLTFDIKDELYINELQPGIVVHFTSKHEGMDIPVVWTYTYGNGRVLYAGPGHTAKTLENKEYKKLLQQGLRWVAYL